MPHVYAIRQRVLTASEQFLRSRGALGHEGFLLWIGVVASPHLTEVTRIKVPDQVATATPDGVSVDLTPEAHWSLTDDLTPGETFVARVHSHPGCAFHSAKDDANPVLTHDGAISIVVPNFARLPLTLSSCAIYRLRFGSGWEPVPADDVSVMFHVVEG